MLNGCSGVRPWSGFDRSGAVYAGNAVDEIGIYPGWRATPQSAECVNLWMSLFFFTVGVFSA